MHHENELKTEDWYDDNYVLNRPLVLSQEDFEMMYNIVKNSTKASRFIVDLMKEK